MTAYHTLIEGASALSPFRAQQLLTRLQARHAAVSMVSGRYLYLVDWRSAPSPLQLEQMDRLLNQGAEQGSDPTGGHAVWWVSPRLGTLSPWASKATDIARNCGLPVQRVERAIEYRIALKGWRKFQIDNAGIVITGNSAISMGNVTLWDAKGNMTKVDKTWAWTRGADGNLKIVLHHSSLPYSAK